MSLFNNHKPVFPMPRMAFGLLMVCVSLSVLPHITRIPVWLSLGFVAILLWRIQIFRQKVSMPARWMRLILVCLGFLAVYKHHGTVFGPDAGVALLITAYLFKQLEMYTKRDAFLVVILSYFVLATEFLYSRSLLTTFYVFLNLVVITTTLIAINQSHSNQGFWATFKKGAIVCCQAVPLMVVLFLFFPRIGPIWGIDLNNSDATIGLSDQMTPGDIAQLSRSEKLAFRAEFEGDSPPMRERYWRAVVFDYFDGKTWHAMQESAQDFKTPDDATVQGEPYRYKIYLEPTDQKWLFAIPKAKISGISYKASKELMLFSDQKIDSAISYNVTSYPDYQYSEDSLTEYDKHRFTALPSFGDTKTAGQAQQWMFELQYDSQQLSDRLLEWFFNEEFVYTLKPPTLGKNSIDEFLFETRRGFCAHFAGAYVYMMRAAGVPARLIGGYQGGVEHPIGRYIQVHQYDAHAWAEYWQPGKGWVRVDPTAAVAPHRVESGPINSASDSSFFSDSPLSPQKLRNFAFIKRLRNMMDYADYLWFKNVVSFDKEEQASLFESLMGQVTPMKIAIFTAAIGCFVVLIVALMVLMGARRLSRRDKADRIYVRFQNKFRKKGLVIPVGEAPSIFALRASQDYPEQSSQILFICNLYSVIKYADHCSDSADIAGELTRFERAVKQIKI